MCIWAILIFSCTWVSQNSFCKYIVWKIWKYLINSIKKVLLQEYFLPHCKAGGKIPHQGKSSTILKVSRSKHRRLCTFCKKPTKSRKHQIRFWIEITLWSLVLKQNKKNQNYLSISIIKAHFELTNNFLLSLLTKFSPSCEVLFLCSKFISQTNTTMYIRVSQIDDNGHLLCKLNVPAVVL